MPRKRPTESSWDSDEELLGDTSSVSAFSSKKGGDDDIDEDALLGIGDDGMQEYSEGQEYSFTTSEIDIGLDTSVGLDGTADSQLLAADKDEKHTPAELDYEDIPEENVEEFVLEENTDIEDPLMVDEQPNQTTCTVQNTQPSAAGEDDNDSDDDDDKRDRGRFQTERNTTSSLPSSKHTSSIPDSLEITKEMQEEIDTFEKQKGQKGKFNNRRGGGRGQQQNNRGRGGQMRGGQIMQQRMQGPGIRQMGPHGGSPNRMRGPGPHGFQQRPMGQPMRPNSGGGRPQLFTQRGRAMNQAMNRGQVPRFPHEMVRPSNHDNQSRQPAPQQFMSSQPMQIQPMYTEQHQFSHAQHPQPVHTYPGHSQPQPIHPQHTQQPILHSPQQPPHSITHSQQPTVSTIHVNPKFHGGLPPSSVHQHSPQQGLLPQPLYSQHQPTQNYPDSQQAWSHQQHLGQQGSPAPGGYPPSPQLYPPQPQPLLPDPQHRPVNPTALMPPPGHLQQQNHNNLTPQNSHQMQPRPLLQPHQHRPNQPQHSQHVRHIGPSNTPRNPHPGPHQTRPQRPLANQNMRGPRPANQMSGNVRAVRPTGGQQFKPRNPQGNQRMKTPQQGGQPSQPQGFNPPPNQIAAVKTEIDPEKERKMKEMEEKKRLRAERFKSNTPVEVHEGSPSNKKVIATKRTSGEDPADDGVSPAKTIKIETLANMKPDPSAVNSDAGLSKALEEQKKRRELIMKIKEAKRQATAEQKRKALALEQKAATAGKPTDNQPMEIQQGNQQQQQQQQQANRGRGRGQNFNRGQGRVNIGGQGRGQPISVLGQKQNNLVQIQTSDEMGDHGFNQGQGHIRGRGQHRGQGQGQRGIVMNRGRGRGVQSSPNVVNLQQVNIQDNAVNVNVVNRTLHEPSNNRTVLTSSATRQVVGMNPRGAASQFSPGRKVIDKSDDGTAPRRIVVNSLDTNQSSTVLIKDLPAKVDLGKVNKKCAQHGSIKSFNYRADAKQIVVQYSSPSEAASFIQKNPKFMIDMGYLTASSIPDGSM